MVAKQLISQLKTIHITSTCRCNAHHETWFSTNHKSWFSLVMWQ